MQSFCNSWCVRNLLVMVLRLNKSLKSAESIMILHPHQTAQAQHQLSSLSTVDTPLLECNQQPQRRTLSVALNPHAEGNSPQTAGDLHTSNFTILNTINLHARRIWLFAACPDLLNPLSVINSMGTMIQSKTWTRFPTSNTLQTLQTRSFHHLHLLCCRQKHTPAPVLRWAITLPNDRNPTLRVALRWTYKAIPTTRLRRVMSTNISSVGGWRRAWWRTNTTCWRKKTPHCVSQPSKMVMASRRSWLACQMIRLLGCENYTLSRVWNGMTITNALSNTGVETSSQAWDGWCCSQPTLGIIFTPLSVTLTAKCHWNTSILKWTLRTGGGGHR